MKLGPVILCFCVFYLLSFNVLEFNPLQDSGRIIKLYNRLATTFYKFETLWLTNWVTTVEPIRSALRATLLVRDSAGDLHVNMDPKILELIQETKWLLRLNCNVPEGAKEVLKQVYCPLSFYKNYLMPLIRICFTSLGETLISVKLANS